MAHRSERDIKSLARFEKVQCLGIMFIILPGYYWVGMIVALPKLLQLSFISRCTYYLHSIFGTYCFINVAGNLMLSYLTDTRLKDYHGPGTYCQYCKQNRPAETWHCKVCNACIIRRDHHCCFLAHCIGRKNIRYFICMHGHLALSMAYCMYYNFLVIYSEFNFISFMQTVLIILKPYLIYNVPNPPDFEDTLIVLVWLVDLLVLPSSMYFCFVHLRNVVQGVTANQYLKGKAPSKALLTSKLEYVFGTRWYLAMFWPFVDSPLPDNILQID
ncbi:probable palmitoyltransferase ZDHHC24 [Cydia fagiglandana]|uniref:probable palmitoyltransferase ZDHHC24 n=1 Tax=Cydia fagiglandana TaxID=1458189 RepID=UPI002FEE20A8